MHQGPPTLDAAYRLAKGLGVKLSRLVAEAEAAIDQQLGRAGRGGWVEIPVTGRHLLALSGLLLGAVLGTPAHAQEAPLTAAQELAKDARNPFAEFVKLPVEFMTGFGVGPRHRAGESINVQPVVPLSLSAEWELIFRPSVTATYLPDPRRAVRARGPPGVTVPDAGRGDEVDLGPRTDRAAPHGNHR